MKQSETILFFGNERLATGVTTQTPVLKALVSNGYNIAAIVSVPESAAITRKPRPLEIGLFAATHHIPLIELRRLGPAIEQLKEFNAQAAVLASFGRLIPQEVIDVFPDGIINVHPSLLPLHRGPIPIESVILAGEKQTGVSLMRLVAEMDAGPLFDQSVLPLEGAESKQELADRLGEIGAQRLISLLPDILSGRKVPVPQKGSPTYDKRLESAEGSLDYKLPAEVLERQIRAFLGWPRSKSVIEGIPVVITKARVLKDQNAEAGKFIVCGGELALGTSRGLLVIDRLIPAGAREMSGQEFLRGHPLKA